MFCINDIDYCYYQLNDLTSDNDWWKLKKQICNEPVKETAQTRPCSQILWTWLNPVALFNQYL